MQELIFSKRLTKTAINRMLCIPTKSLPTFPPFAEGNHVQPLIVHDMEEQWIVWNLRLSVRRHGHRKPIVEGDWVHFVRRKKLKIGDGVKFFGSFMLMGTSPIGSDLSVIFFSRISTELCYISHFYFPVINQVSYLQ